MVVREIIDALKKYDEPLILPHMEADGDCLGSAIALALALRKMGKAPVVCLEENISDTYEFLPGRDMVRIYTQEQDIDAELAVAIDTGDLNRLGKRAGLFTRAKVTVNIDHHDTNTYFGMLNDVRPGCSSVGEIMVGYVDELGTGLDKETAECLYVAISFDTGGFRYGNTTSQTHIAASRLVDAGIDVAGISRKIFETVSYEKIALIGEATRTIRLYCGGLVAVMHITGEMLEKTGASEEDCEGLVNLGRSIRGVEVSVLLKERQDSVKVNLRSNSYVNVAEIASLFDGGGHQRAAGCVLNDRMDQAEHKVMEVVKERVCSAKRQG